MKTTLTKFFQNTSVTCMLLLVLVGAIIVPNAAGFSYQKAEAQVATVEVGNTDPVEAAYKVTTATAQTTQTFITKVLDGLAWTVAKIAIQSMTRSIVNWINSGFHGSPAFATDLNKTLRGVADAAVDRFIYDLKNQAGVDVKTPFGDQVAQAVRNSYYRESAAGLQRNYNLNQSSTDPQGFLDGQFKEGGFDAWFATVLNEDNNPLNSLFKARTELDNTVANVRDNQLHELDWGNGFLSWRGSCAQYATTPTHESTHGDTPVDTSQKDNCLSYNIETPGSVIENQLNITATSPLRQLELADSINEIVSALMGQLVNHILGPGGLLGASSPSSGGGSSALEQATSPSQYDSVTSTLADGFNQEIQRQQSSVGTFQSNWQKINTAATQAQNACASTTAGNTIVAASGSTATTTLNVRIAQVSGMAAVALARATSALSALGSIGTNISSGAHDAGTLTSAYQNVLSGNTIPSADEMMYAQIQSQTSGTTTSATLYDEMTQAVKTCNPFGNSAIQ